MRVKKYRYTFLAGLLIGGGFLLWAGNTLEDAFSFGPDGTERKFDQQLWISSSGESTRAEMLEDVKIYYLRRGMSKREVIKILGKPDKSGHFDEYSPSSKYVSYDIGFVFLDPCTFDLEFSEDGKLISFSENCS